MEVAGFRADFEEEMLEQQEVEERDLTCEHTEVADQQKSKTKQSETKQNKKQKNQVCGA